MVMVFVLMVRASVRKAGKVSIVERWIRMRYNVFQIARDTVHSNSTHNRAFVMPNGVETTVPRNCVTLIVVLMAVVSERRAVVTMVGAVNSVIRSYVIRDAMNMDNARMARACV